MNILILNNTESYHYGCKSVMSVLKSQFPTANIALKNKDKSNIFNNIFTNSLNPLKFKIIPRINVW